MKRIRWFALGLALVALVSGSVYAERRTKTISATDTSQTVSLARASTSISVVNGGLNEVYLRVFQEGDDLGAATVTDPSVYIPAGASVDFPALPGEGRYFAVSAICSTGETTSVYVYY